MPRTHRSATGHDVMTLGCRSAIDIEFFSGAIYDWDKPWTICFIKPWAESGERESIEFRVEQWVSLSFWVHAILNKVDLVTTPLRRKSANPSHYGLSQVPNNGTVNKSSPGLIFLPWKNLKNWAAADLNQLSLTYKGHWSGKVPFVVMVTKWTTPEWE